MLTALRRRLSDDRGLTVTELLIVVLLFGVIMPPVYMFLMSTTRNERVVQEATEQQQSARVAMEVFSRQMRESGYAEGLSASSSSIFLSAGNDFVTFYSDADSDLVNERITYALDPGNGEIDRTIVEPDCSVTPCSYGSSATSTTSNGFVSHVRNNDLTACGDPPGSLPVFSYWQADPGTGALTQITTPTTELSDLVDINYVKMTLIVDVRPGESPTCHELNTSVSLRNWRG